MDRITWLRTAVPGTPRARPSALGANLKNEFGYRRQRAGVSSERVAQICRDDRRAATQHRQWLRDAAALGVDVASIDYGQSSDFRVHRIAAARDAAGRENLTNLEQLPPGGALVIALPMKIEGGSSGPCERSRSCRKTAETADLVRAQLLRRQPRLDPSLRPAFNV
jgi:hypothetical protein